MELRKIMLEPDAYQHYVNGEEIECTPDRLENQEVNMGEHVMVFKDTIAATSNVNTPTREKQAEYIGLEGEITQVNKLAFNSDAEHVVLQSVILKKI